METGPQKEVLMIGLPGSGKTLLAKRLQTLCQKQAEPLSTATVVTNGLELFSVTLAKGDAMRSIIIRELGGSMLPIWPKYFTNVHAVVFALDMADATSLAAAAMELYEVLQAEPLQHVPLCVALTKADLPMPLSRAELDLTLGLSELERLYPCRLWLVEVSAVEGPDQCPTLRELLDWMVSTKAGALQQQGQQQALQAPPQQQAMAPPSEQPPAGPQLQQQRVAVA